MDVLQRAGIMKVGIATKADHGTEMNETNVRVIRYIVTLLHRIYASTVQRFNGLTARSPFGVNVVLIALAHIVLIAGLIRWSVAAKASSNPESIVWLGGAGDLSADESEEPESSSPKQPATETESSR